MNETTHFLKPKDFYPRPPRGGRQLFALLLFGHILISIHALREEGDSIRLQCGYALL